jgi:hypothetical protein
MNQLLKSFFLIALSICISANVSAQSEKPTIEIGVNFLQFTVLPSDDLGEFDDAYLMPSIGLSFKTYKKPTFVHRVSLNYLNRNGFTDNNFNSGFFTPLRNDKGLNVTLGIERLFAMGKLQTYVLADVYLMYGKREVYAPGPCLSCWDSFALYQYFQIGLTSGFGSKLRLSDKLYANIEMNVRFVRELKKNEFSNNNFGNYQFFINPISRFSLNYKL